MAKAKTRRCLLISITACLNVLFWSSLGILCLVIYLFATKAVDYAILPSIAWMLVSVIASFSYTVLHVYISVHHQKQTSHGSSGTNPTRTGAWTFRLLFFACMLWLFASGWNLIIAARQPVCLKSGTETRLWAAGTGCVVEKICTALGVIALVASCVLSLFLTTVHQPFDAHIFSCTYIPESEGTISPIISRRLSALNDKILLLSEASYSTRSFASFSVTSAYGSSTPEEVIGLGIYTDCSSSINTLDSPLPSRRTDSLLSILTLLRPVQPAVVDSTWRAVHPPLESFRSFFPTPSPGTSPTPTIRDLSPSLALFSTADQRLRSRHNSEPLRLSRYSFGSSGTGFPLSPLSSMRRASEPDILIEENRMVKERIRKANSDTGVPVLPELPRISRLTHPVTWDLKIVDLKIPKMTGGARPEHAQIRRRSASADLDVEE